MNSLWCLLVPCRIKYKLISLVLKGLHNLDPTKHFRHNSPTIVTSLSPEPKAQLSHSFPLSDHFLGTGRESTLGKDTEMRVQRFYSNLCCFLAMQSWAILTITQCFIFSYKMRRLDYMDTQVFCSSKFFFYISWIYSTLSSMTYRSFNL